MTFTRRIVQFLPFVNYTLVGVILLLPLILGSYWQFFVAQMVIASYVAISFNLVYSYGKLLSFSQAVFFAIGAYSALYLATESQWSLLSIFAVAISASVLIGAIFASVFVRMGGHNPTIATVILSSVALLSANALGKYTGSEDGLAISAAYVGIAGLGIQTGPGLGLYYAAAVPLVILVISLQLLQKTSFWKVIRAVAANETRAQQLGFDVRTRRLAVIAFSAGVAGLGGVFYALLMKHVSTATFDVVLSVNAILYAVVGGLGTIAGPILGVFIIYPLTEIIAHFFLYVQILIGAVLILVAIFFPRGILGTLHDLGDKEN